MKRILLSRGICRSSPIWLAFWASTVSGVAVAIVTCPFDVTAVRMQNQGPAIDGKLIYKSIWKSLKMIYKTEGFLGLYKGIVPLYLRMAPQTTIALILWDLLNDLLDI